MAVMAQRLVRRLCLTCRQPMAPEPSPRCASHRPHAATTSQGRTIYRAVGCRECRFEGYRGPRRPLRAPRDGRAGCARPRSSARARMKPARAGEADGRARRASSRTACARSSRASPRSRRSSPWPSGRTSRRPGVTPPAPRHPNSTVAAGWSRPSPGLRRSDAPAAPSPRRCPRRPSRLPRTTPTHADPRPRHLPPVRPRWSRRTPRDLHLTVGRPPVRPAPGAPAEHQPSRR